MQDYEKLGLFYLGKLYDLDKKQAAEELLLYDSRDLVTHAVVVGMTGSGKTGLCVDLIEEAAIDGVPAIVIDPKGDLADLMLTFPQLRPEDFQPWVNTEEARLKGLDPDAYAAKQAATWKSGLESWGQSGDRIAKMKDAADFRIYTPASSAGIPVSILKSFAAPSADALEDSEMLRERVGTTVTSLLGLVGIEADPVQSREYILLSNIIETTWRKGQDLDLGSLIQQVQNPPVTRIGVLDLETFYPSKDRFGLVMALNNLLASPGFAAWLEGEPLDMPSILYTPQGKPRIAIFSIAHLGDAERMFFVSLLLNQVLSWMRSQPGTTSLRAILYMDEIFGFLPPTKNPPSKMPMLTLLKQARAFGLGLVLATQNPVDLDYKALSNAGTWFIGRLQTERDKLRVLDGLEGASAAAGSMFDRQSMDRILSGLGNRVFLMNNTHEDAPVVMTTRWAMSYLCGPLTREQIRKLMAPVKAAAQPAPAQPAAQPTSYKADAFSTAAPTSATGATQPVSVTPRKPAAPAVPAANTQPPPLPPEVQSYYLPVRGRAVQGTKLIYRPQLYGAARVLLADTKTRVSTIRACQYLTAITETAISVDWQTGSEIDVAVSDLEKRPAEGSIFEELPSEGSSAKSYTGWSRDFANWLYGCQVLDLLRSPSTGLVSNPGEDERSFRLRVGQGAREKRDDTSDALRKKYAPKIATLQNRLRNAQQVVQREKDQARQAGMQTAISIGATLLGAFTGRRGSTVGRATTAARSLSRSANERGDISRAEEDAQAIQKDLEDLNAQFKEEMDALEARIDPMSEALETFTIKPKKADIDVKLVALAWAPYWQSEDGTLKPAW